MVLHNGCIPTDPSASKAGPVAVQGASESCVTWTERPGVVKTAVLMISWWISSESTNHQFWLYYSYQRIFRINQSTNLQNQPIFRINQSTNLQNQPINQSTNQPIPNVWLYLPIVRLGISSESTGNPVLFTNQDKMAWQRDFEHCSWLAILVIDLHSGG